MEVPWADWFLLFCIDEVLLVCQKYKLTKKLLSFRFLWSRCLPEILFQMSSSVHAAVEVDAVPESEEMKRFMNQQFAAARQNKLLPPSFLTVNVFLLLLLSFFILRSFFVVIVFVFKLLVPANIVPELIREIQDGIISWTDKERVCCSRSSLSFLNN